MAHVDSQPPRRGPSLTQQIFIGLALGIIAGWLVSEYNPAAAAYFRPFSQLFLRLIKMIIAPLIFATLVAGIAGAGHVKVVGRMGLRAIIYFEIVTTLALVIGLVTVNVRAPGLSRSDRQCLMSCVPPEIDVLGRLNAQRGGDRIRVHRRAEVDGQRLIQGKAGRDDGGEGSPGDGYRG